MAMAISSTSSACWATEKACSPTVWPFQRATRASPCAMSSISMSRGRRIEQIEAAPRQHALPGPLRAGRLGAARGLLVARLDHACACARRRLEPRCSSAHGSWRWQLDQVVVDHARRLHEGIDRRRTDEAEAFRLQRLGDGLGGRRLGRHRLEARVPVDLRAPVEEIPTGRPQGSCASAASGSPWHCRWWPRS